MSNILIIKHGSLGDIAQACGAIQDIYENHNNDQIYLLTTKPYFELFKKNPYLTDVILDKRLSRFNLIYLYSLMRRIKKLKISKVYDLQNSSRTGFYKRILFPSSNLNIWSSSETTLPNDKTKVTAVGAYDIIKSTKVFRSTAESVKSFDIIISLSARSRDINKKHITIKDFEKILKIKKNKKIGLMFGPEASGLSNQDLSLAQGQLIETPLET